MISANDSTLRVLADGLIHQAEMRPRRSESARLLRDAAAALLDADTAVHNEALAKITPPQDKAA